MECVCPRCRSFQSTNFCPACGTPTRPANGCSQCDTSYIDGRFCGECGAPSWRTVLQGGIPKSGSQQEIRKQGSRPNDVKVDTSSILKQGITPSAVFRGVNAGDDTISKYRISSTEEANENIDWRQTIKNASRAAVEEPEEVVAQRSTEPTVYVSNQNQYQRPANVGPLPSEQLRRDDNVYSRTPAPTSPTVVPRQPSQPVVSPKTGNLPPPPGPSRTVYTPPPQPTSPYRSVGVTVAESTIRPSLLRDTSDPLEKYRVQDTAAPDNNSSFSAGNTSKNPESDPLQKYRVKTAEEEETTWHFFLSNLSADPGKPVELKCDGEVVFLNEGANGFVNTHVAYAAAGDSTSVVLTIKAIPFTVNKSLEIAKGRFVKFSIESGGLRFRQQRTEIDD